MSDKKHAMLSASSADRWLICSPSAKLSAEMESNESNESGSVYADEGTLAHNIAELRIKELAYNVDLSKHLNKLYLNPLFSEEMVDYVEEYAKFVVERIHDAPHGAMFFQEYTTNLREWVPDGFGTTDVTIASDEVLEVIDLKYGKGVPVSAYENSQLLLYALGMHRDMSLLFNYKKVLVTIYQPRINNISSYECSVDNLVKWSREVLRPSALKAYAGIGELIPGDHCKFCKKKPTCFAFSKYNLEVAKRTFDITDLTFDQISQILSRSESIKSWINSVKEYSLKKALNGQKIPGFKLVAGRSVRKITNIPAVIEILNSLGIPEEKYLKKELVGITELTKILGTKRLNQYLSDYIEKPDGRPSLVVDSDGRPEYDRNAAAYLAFEDVEDQGETE